MGEGLGTITVQPDIFERQGMKTVAGPDDIETIWPGEPAKPDDVVLAREGFPAFRLRLAHDIADEASLPAGFADALSRSAARVQRVLVDGTELPEEHEFTGDWATTPPVEFVLTRFVDGALDYECDTDGGGLHPKLVQAIVKILTEELQPLRIPVHISAAPRPPADQ